jgi:hypothetical protein
VAPRIAGRSTPATKDPNTMTTPRKAATLVAATIALAAVAVAPSLADGDSGPDTCLNGFVWRDAGPADHVCVSTATRTQAAADNAQAATRRDPSGACLTGFVSRGAFAGDQVCVLPATRTSVVADNAAAASRRVSVRLTISKYSPPQQTCPDEDTCTTNNDDAPRYRATANHINVGKVRLFLRRLNGTKITSWTLTAATNPAAPGGRISFRTGRLACSGKNNAYFQLQDLSSGRVSTKHGVRTGCATL